MAAECDRSVTLPAMLARLARAVHLDARPLDAGRWLVTGGAAPHVVAEIESVTGCNTPVPGRVVRETCDCVDFRLRGGPCKHVLAVRLRRGDAEALDGLRELVPAPRRPRTRRTATATEAVA